ncbi:hypothetical protein HK099_004165 [Clydaea vesicula]|uniref:Uncharacterized protein n=1 Tax=Clydaea vesicula TaxID=447962 RepID=A0AAD5U2P1_9FUNG|nr:hypothetical protein HK099_004165 [Clydaea vesicula]
MNESFVYDNEAPTYGRSFEGQRILRPRKRHGESWTFFLAILLNGLVHNPLISTENAREENFLDYVRNTLVPHPQEGEVVLWDRFEAMVLIVSKGARIIFLPPQVKFFNPVKLVFGTVKLTFEIHTNYTIARTEVEVRSIVKESCDKITETAIEGYFRERGGGREFKRLYSDLL